LNGWKSWAIFSGGNPAPVSVTVIRTRPDTVLAVQWTATEPPALLYLMALERRLIRTCLMRVRSALTQYAASLWGELIRMPRRCARGSIIEWHSSSSSLSETGSTDIESFPDSIVARSRISLINSSRYQPAFRIWMMLSP
jgi:hypothetical protein